jgi:hypothetical protein
MGYRKIEVGGKEYEYTIGREFVKIKTIGVFPCSEIGEWAENLDYPDTFFEVRPEHIKNLITRHTL